MELAREIKDGKTLLELYRQQRQYTYLTLEGSNVEPNLFARQMFDYWSKQIDILSQTIGGRAKTRIKKELTDNEKIICPTN